MLNVDLSSMLSSRRAQLASFEHAYAVALHLRHDCGVPLFIINTGNPIQPFRVTAKPPANDEAVLAMVA